jgi:hypothetical protein
MNQDEVIAIVHALARYLRSNPLACDSAAGIAQWWLPESEVSMEAVLHALECLKEVGALEETAGADGRVRYRRRGGNKALDAAVAALEGAPRQEKR